jgi:tight adherence protein B
VLIWFRSLIDGAGLGRYGSAAVLGVLIVASLALGLVIYEITEVTALAVSGCVGVIGVLLEGLTLKAKSRRKMLARLWPEVLDSLVSAASAGISVSESMLDLSESGPAVLRGNFRTLIQNLDAGDSLPDSLEKLKTGLGERHVDRLVELLRIVHAAGGQGYHQALKNQVRITRDELALWGEIESKQGWVTGTAKIAVAAPWLVVAMLCSRSENVASFSSTSGTAILLIGLIVSIFAYRLIQVLGIISVPRRVFLS